MARLRQDCVLAKESLSIDTETAIPVFLPNRHFDVQLTRADFEDMIRAPIESTIGTLVRTLRSAQVDPNQLSAVLLVGGSSRIPLVSRMISEELGRPTVVDAHPKYAVALGAATPGPRRRRAPRTGVGAGRGHASGPDAGSTTVLPSATPAPARGHGDGPRGQRRRVRPAAAAGRCRSRRPRRPEELPVYPGRPTRCTARKRAGWDARPRWPGRPAAHAATAVRRFLRVGPQARR